MLRATAIAALIGLMTFAPTFANAAQPDDRGPTPGLGWGPGGSKGGTMVGAPGPIAGIGLPVLAVAGGLIWIKRRRRPI